MTAAVVRVSGSHRVLRRRRRWPWVGLALILLLVLTSGAVAWRSTHDTVGETTVTASSTALGFSARDVVTGSAVGPGPGWRSNGELAGAWIELSWQRNQELRQILLIGGPVGEPGVTDGFLTFGDGSYLQVRLSLTTRETVIPIAARSVDRVRFTASAVAEGAPGAGLDEIVLTTEAGDDDVVDDHASGGNAALSASAAQSGGPSEPRAVADGADSTGWIVDGPDAWVELEWDRPRELASIQIVGMASGATVRRAEITFADGARLPVGAVLPDPARPTVVGFMPRVTTSVRLTVQTVDGDGPAALAELRTFGRGVTPPRAEPGAGTGRLLAGGTGCPPSDGDERGPGPVVLCPRSGSVVDGRVDVEVAAEGYSSVSGTVWPADGNVPAGAPVTVIPDAAGRAVLDVDVSSAPPGPLTLELVAEAFGRLPETVHFQLYRSGVGGRHVPSSTPASGRTLVYAEEFDGPIALSRTGEGADYAAAKPTYAGAEDFGDAIFVDPAAGLDTVQVVDDNYLRIDVEPRPRSFPDPEGFDRSYLGGLLASARTGGSGFSAQYGYFEARMLAPAAPGTWPAFWTLPSDNLVAPTPVVAEIDAVELYGHEPTGACHVTHEFANGADGGESDCGQRFGDAHAALSWHTYGVSITPTENTFYIDGQVVASLPQVDGGGAPMFFLVNLALGGGWPIELGAVQGRAQLYVDHIRVYV